MIEELLMRSELENALRKAKTIKIHFPDYIDTFPGIGSVSGRAHEKGWDPMQIFGFYTAMAMGWGIEVVEWLEEEAE